MNSNKRDNSSLAEFTTRSNRLTDDEVADLKQAFSTFVSILFIASINATNTYAVLHRTRMATVCLPVSDMLNCSIWLLN